MVLVLGANIFEFDGQLYKQKDGTAIGTRAAPTFANLFMGEWEKALQDGWTGTKLDFYLRFIDDLFFLWWGTVDELVKFVEFASSIIPPIKVAVDYDFGKRSVNYLDMTVFIDNEGFIRTDLYKKENRRVAYLMPSSAHPGHVTRNIPYSLAYRIRRICWSEELLETRLTELCTDLVSRSYRRRSILDSFERVRQVPRAEAIKRMHRDRETNQRVRFIVKYDPRLPDIRSTLLRSWKVMTEDKEMKRVFPNPPMVCYQKVKSHGGDAS